MLVGILHYSPLIQILLLLLFFHLGAKRSELPVKRATFWGTFVAVVMLGVALNAFLEWFYPQQTTMGGLYLGLALQFALTSAVVFFYAQVAAGRARDAGYSNRAAWAVWIPLLGPLWLGMVKSANAQSFR